MKVSGKKGHAKSFEVGSNHPSGNGSGTGAAADCQFPARERSGSGQPAASGSGKVLPARKSTGPRTAEGKRRSKVNSLKHGIFSRSVLLEGESQAEYNSLLDGLVERLAPEGELEKVLVQKIATTVWRHSRLLRAERAEIRKGIDFMGWDQEMREQKELREIDCSSVLNDQGGFMSRIDNPYVLERCLDLLADLREQVAEVGLTKGDTVILQRLYGDPNCSNLGDGLFNEYLCWSQIPELSEDEQCKSSVLDAIDEEIQRLKKHQKARAAIESERMQVEAVRRVVPESPALDRLLRYEASLERSFERTLSQLERLQRMRLGLPVPHRVEVQHTVSQG